MITSMLRLLLKRSLQMVQKTAKSEEAPDRADIEAQIARIRADIGALGSMMQAYGSEKLKGAQHLTEGFPDEALAELQRQLSGLEDELTEKVREHPLRSLGLAALAGLIVGLFLRR